jgi:hypothetical protein
MNYFLPFFFFCLKRRNEEKKQSEKKKTPRIYDKIDQDKIQIVHIYFTSKKDEKKSQ